MVYTKKSPALFIIGVVMLAIWYVADSGMIAPYIEHLGGNKYKYLAELKSIPLYFGIIAAAFGLLQWLVPVKEGSWAGVPASGRRKGVCDIREPREGS
jgi:hypothetical protein